MMNRRGWTVFLFICAIWLGLTLSKRHAHSAEADYCVEIRKAVAMVGAKNIETFARSNGATDAQIAQGKACLHRNHKPRSK